MGPVNALKICYAKYGNFNGRACRTEFFWFQVLWLLLLSGCAAVDILLITYAWPPVFTPVFLTITLLPYLSVCVRRFHDFNMSTTLAVISALTCPPGMILCAFIPGTEHENDFGPDPRPGIRLENIHPIYSKLS